MCMPAIDVPVTTIEQLLALPEDGLRHELLGGEHVVTPSPIRLHQGVSTELVRQFANFTVQNPSFSTYHAPADVRMGSNTLVQPDVFVVSESKSADVDPGRDIEVPELLVEILSPGTAPRDRGKKREIYQAAGVPEYWIVDIDSRLVERWRPADERPEILRDSITWQPDNTEKGVTIDLVDLFARVTKRK